MMRLGSEPQIFKYLSAGLVLWSSLSVGACEDSAGLQSRRPILEVTPQPITFDTVPVGSRAEQRVEIKNVGDIALNIARVEWAENASAEFRLVDVESVINTLAPNESASFAVAFVPATLGDVTAVLRFVSDDPETPQLDVDVVATRRQGPVLVTCIQSADIPVAQRCETNPHIAFGDATIGETFEATLVLRSEGTDPVTVQAIQLLEESDMTFSIESAPAPVTLAVGEQHSITVRYAPIAQLPAEGKIAIVSNDPQNTNSTATLTGKGTEPWLCLTPDFLDFRNTAIGGVREETIEVSNCGSGDTVTVTKLEIIEPPGAFTIVNPLTEPFDLPAVEGVAYAVKIRFAPTQQGESRGRFRAHADRGRATAQLSANAAGCHIVPFPGRIEIPIEQGPEPRTVTFQNDGSAPCRLNGLVIDRPELFELQELDSVDDATLEPGGVARVEIHPLGQMIAETEANLQLTYRPEAAPGAEPSTATVRVVIVREVDPGPCSLTVAPLEIRFGAVAPNATRRMGILTVSSCGTNVTLDPGSDPSFTLHVEDTLHVVQFAPTSAGRKSGSLIVDTDEPMVAPVTVPLSGFAGSAGICVTPENVDFGDVQLESTLSFTISACADAAVIVDRLDWSRPDSEIVLPTAPALPLTLAAGASRTVDVRYTPLDNTGDTAVLAVGSNDPVRPQIDVRVTGGPSTVPPSAGRFLYYWQIREDSNIMRIPLQGNPTPEPVVGPAAGNASCGGCHVVSPDGRFVAASNSFQTVQFYDAQTKTEFVPPVRLEDGTSVSWNPNVATDPPYQFVYDRGGDIVRASLFTGTIGPVVGASGSGGPYSSPSWSSDGRIAFVQRGGGGGPEVMLVSEDGGVATPLVGASGNSFGNALPTFSPNSAWIAITQSATGQGQSLLIEDGRIRLVKSDNSGTVRSFDGVNGLSSASTYARWSADGTFLSFSSNRPGGPGSWDIYLVSVDPLTGMPGVPFQLQAANGSGMDTGAQWTR